MNLPPPLGRVCLPVEADEWAFGCWCRVAVLMVFPRGKKGMWSGSGHALGVP